MKTTINPSFRVFGLLLVLTAVLLSATGCLWLITPQPQPITPLPSMLIGWKEHNATIDPPNQTNFLSGQIYHINKAILDDYKEFIEQQKTKHPSLYVTEIDFYEDETGQHAVKLVIEIEMQVYVDYYLIYDKFDTRFQKIEGKKRHGWHI
jgi:hypothetical protein